MLIKELHVGSLSGIHHELYSPDTDSLFLKELPDNNKALLSLNSLFWGLHLKKENITALINILKKTNNSLDIYPPAYRAISSNPRLFLEQVEEAVLNLCDQSIGEKIFYKYIETLAILCQLYSDFKYKPHLLTIYEGFTVFELSSINLYENCLNPSFNPYLDFILKYCLPIIKKTNPELVWLNGRISVSSMAIARLVREINPKAHIAVVGHSSEYYSLNKLDKYLLHNYPLFSVIDSIILDDEEDSRKNLIDALSNKKSLESVPNLMYVDRKKNEKIIKKTNYTCNCSPLFLDKHATFRRKTTIKKFNIDPSSIVDIKLFPENACYWNKCSFCGINKKYHGNLMKNKNWDINSAIKTLDEIYAKGTKYIWLTDEAIPSNILYSISQKLIEKKINIIWQARSRFEIDFLDEKICKSLAKSGLKEIRFGLESASPRILKLMNKFPESINLGEIKKIIKLLDEYDISVHCPVIIGYPTESADDREYTYNFLNELMHECKNFSYNINIFSLDINSPLFVNWDQHSISSISLPCLPEHFLGNLVDWNCVSHPFNRQQLEIERNNLMRKHLYPWMPLSSLTPPHIFYRLTETIRNTLTFKSTPKTTKKINISSKNKLKISNKTTLSSPREFTNDLYQLYNWENHSIAHLSPDIAKFLEKNFHKNKKSLDDLKQPYKQMMESLYEQQFIKLTD